MNLGLCTLVIFDIYETILYKCDRTPTNIYFVILPVDYSLNMADVHSDNERVSNERIEEDVFLPEETRPTYRLQSLVELYGINEPNISSIGRVKKYLRKEYSSLTIECCINVFLNKIPLIRCLKEYNLRKNLFGDIIAGITIAIMHIPQGMAYGVLTTLPPVHGNQLFVFYISMEIDCLILYRIVCFFFSCNCLHDLWHMSTFVYR